MDYEDEYEVAVNIEYSMERDGKQWIASATGGSIGKLILDRVQLLLVFGSKDLADHEDEAGKNYEGEG